jgi:hypothetical protein
VRLLRKVSGDPPSIYVLGSSRVMSVNPSLIERHTGRKCFNFGVPHGRAEDFYVITRFILDEAGGKPQAVILGLDFLSMAGEDSRLERTPEEIHDFYNCPALLKYLDARDRPNLLFITLKKLRQTIDRAYVRDVLACLDRTYGKKGFANVCEFNEKGFFAYYAQKDQLMFTGMDNLNREIDKYIKIWSDFFSRPRSISRIRADYLEKFLKLCRDNDVKVIIFLTPMNGRMREAMAKNPNFNAFYAGLSARMKQWQKQYGFSFYDFINVSEFGGSEVDFYDGLHFRHYNGALLTIKILEGDFPASRP